MPSAFSVSHTVFGMNNKTERMRHDYYIHIFFDLLYVRMKINLCIFQHRSKVLKFKLQ
jgi:hypothetical protein